MSVGHVFEDGYGRGSFLRALEGGCANLGHVQDDESNLIYMRARYYDPTSGRFLSEDPADDGINWFIYCRNSPCRLVDRNGRDASLLWWDTGDALAALLAIAAMEAEKYQSTKLFGQILEAVSTAFETYRTYSRMFQAASMLGAADDGGLLAAAVNFGVNKLLGTVLTLLMIQQVTDFIEMIEGGN